jgi:circadian clock protein KaiC
MDNTVLTGLTDGALGPALAKAATGIGGLDQITGGGLPLGRVTLVTGSAGAGKTLLGLEVDLRRWVDTGLLRIWAARPSAFGLETHLAVLARLIEEVAPSVAVLDGIASLAHGAFTPEVTSMVARQLDLLKARGITTLATALGYGDETSTLNVSSMVDTWLLLRNIETNGERNRLLFVLKSRGTAHSNQVREYLLTEHGIELVDVYVGTAGVLVGSARLAQQAAERDAELRHADDLDRRRELRRSVNEREAHLAAVQDQLAAERAEIDRIDLRARHQVADAEADRLAMAARRWADAAPGDGAQR